jgi:hypothetical protein
VLIIGRCKEVEAAGGRNATTDRAGSGALSAFRDFRLCSQESQINKVDMKPMG